MPLISTLCAGAARSLGSFINFKKTPSLPEGTVLFRTDTNTISDWSIKSDWDNWTIIGYSTAGSGAIPSSGWGVKSSSRGIVTVNYSTSSAGDHTGTYLGYCYYYTVPVGYRYQYAWTSTSGAHTHTQNSSWSVSTHTPRTATFPLYKLGATTVPKKSIPPGTLIFTSPNVTLGSGWSKHTLTTSKYVYKPGSSVSTSTSGSDTFALSGTTNSFGAHRHDVTGTLTWGHNVSNTTSAYVPEFDTAQITTHSHTFTSTITITMKARYVSAWVSSQEENIVEDMIIMFDGDTTKIPAGWYPCDGSNGTLDMRDYFPQNYSTVGSTTGSMTGTSPVLSTASWTHGHIDFPASSGLTGTYSYNNFYHGSQSISHTHTITSSTIQQSSTSGNDFRPNNVSVLFLQYKG